MNAPTLLSLALAFAVGCAMPRGASELRSQDPQTRCDAFYRLFRPRLSDEEDCALLGFTTHEVHDLLGTPTSVATLHAAGAEWLQVRYQFEEFPSQAPASARESWEAGWRYSPTVCFRDAIVVSFGRMARETGSLKYPVPPEHLRFEPGGRFPR